MEFVLIPHCSPQLEFGVLQTEHIVFFPAFLILVESEFVALVLLTAAIGHCRLEEVGEVWLGLIAADEDLVNGFVNEFDCEVFVVLGSMVEEEEKKGVQVLFVEEHDVLLIR